MRPASRDEPLQRGGGLESAPANPEVSSAHGGNEDCETDSDPVPEDEVNRRLMEATEGDAEGF